MFKNDAEVIVFSAGQLSNSCANLVSSHSDNAESRREVRHCCVFLTCFRQYGQTELGDSVKTKSTL